MGDASAKGIKGLGQHVSVAARGMRLLGYITRLERGVRLFHPNSLDAPVAASSEMFFAHVKIALVRKADSSVLPTTKWVSQWKEKKREIGASFSVNRQALNLLI